MKDMKNIFRIYAAAVFAVFVVSCGRSVDFDHQTFATFYASSYSVAENGGEISIPVQIYNPNKGDVQVAIRAVDGEGENGAKMNTDYKVIFPENGLLTFSGDVDSLDIVVAIVPNLGVRTASKDFSLRIESVTDGVPTGALQSAKVVIRDMDHPLAHFIGLWSGSTKGEASGADYTFNFTFDSVEGDDNKLSVEFTDPLLSPIVSYIQADVISDKGPIMIPDQSYLGGTLDESPCFYSGLNAPSLDSATNYADIRMVYDAEAMTLTIPNAFAIADEGGFWEVYRGGMILTKK